MQKLTYDIVEEPKGAVYHRLLDYALPRCAIALLVVQHRIPLPQSGQLVLDELAPHLEHKEEAHEWPGTRMPWHTATVYHYRYVPEVAKVMKEAAGGLYDWHQPDLPEDLSLLRSSGEPWLVTIAHEHDSYLLLFPEELQELFDALPALRPVVKEHADSEPSQSE